MTISVKKDVPGDAKGFRGIERELAEPKRSLAEVKRGLAEALAEAGG